jgi:hypothetical protein
MHDKVVTYFVVFCINIARGLQPRIICKFCIMFAERDSDSYKLLICLFNYCCYTFIIMLSYFVIYLLYSYFSVRHALLFVA